MTAEFTQRIKRLAVDRSSGICEAMSFRTSRRTSERCNGDPTEFHHRRNRGKGGSSLVDTANVSNCLYVCSPCHRWVTRDSRTARDMGLSVSAFHQPFAVPVLIWGSWVLLNDDGSKTDVQVLSDETWILDASVVQHYPSWILDGSVPINDSLVNISQSLEDNRFQSWKGNRDVVQGR